MNKDVMNEIQNTRDTYKLLDSNHILAILIYSEVYYEEDNISASLLKIKDVIDIYIYNLILKDNKSLIEETRIKNYFKALIIIIEENPSIYFSNPIFKLNNKLIIEYIGEERYKTIERNAIQYNKNAKIIYDKFINNESSVTKEEYEKLIIFMINTIDSGISNIDQVQENVIYKVLNSNKDYSDIRTKYFILKYILYSKTKNFKQKYKLYFCDEIDGEKIEFLGGQNDEEIIINATYFRNSKLNNFDFISDHKISRKKDKKNINNGLPIYKMFYSLFHEIEHANQTEFLLNGTVNSKSISIIEYILFDEYLGKNEYDLNYRFYEMEIDANEAASKELIVFCEKFIPKKLLLLDKHLVKNKIEQSLKRSYSYKKDFNHEKHLNEIYLVDSLNAMILKNIKVLDQYSCLKEFYNDSGLLRSIDELLLKKDNYKKLGNDDSVFDKFILYHISNGRLNNLNLNCYNDEDKKTILFMIESILNYQIKTLFDINLGLNDNNELKRIGYKIVVEKLKLINNILSFFNTNDVSYMNNLITYDLKQLKKVISLLENKFKRNILLPDEGEIFNEFRYK